MYFKNLIAQHYPLENGFRVESSKYNRGPELFVIANCQGLRYMTNNQCVGSRPMIFNSNMWMKRKSTLQGVFFRIATPELSDTTNLQQPWVRVLYNIYYYSLLHAYSARWGGNFQFSSASWFSELVGAEKPAPLLFTPLKSKNKLLHLIFRYCSISRRNSMPPSLNFFKLSPFFFFSLTQFQDNPSLHCHFF